MEAGSNKCPRYLTVSLFPPHSTPTFLSNIGGSQSIGGYSRSNSSCKSLARFNSTARIRSFDIRKLPVFRFEIPDDDEDDELRDEDFEPSEDDDDDYNDEVETHEDVTDETDKGPEKKVYEEGREPEKAGVNSRYVNLRVFPPYGKTMGMEAARQRESDDVCESQPANKKGRKPRMRCFDVRDLPVFRFEVPDDENEPCEEDFEPAHEEED